MKDYNEIIEKAIETNYCPTPKVTVYNTKLGGVGNFSFPPLEKAERKGFTMTPNALYRSSNNLLSVIMKPEKVIHCLINSKSKYIRLGTGGVINAYLYLSLKEIVKEVHKTVPEKEFILLSRKVYEIGGDIKPILLSSDIKDIGKADKMLVMLEGHKDITGFLCQGKHCNTCLECWKKKKGVIIK